MNEILFSPSKFKWFMSEHGNKFIIFYHRFLPQKNFKEFHALLSLASNYNQKL
jgi:hypothetical protein